MSLVRVLWANAMWRHEDKGGEDDEDADSEQAREAMTIGTYHGTCEVLCFV